jgi:hypothetical protein
MVVVKFVVILAFIVLFFGLITTLARIRPHG